MSYCQYASLSSYISTSLQLGLMELGFFAPKIALMRFNYKNGILYRCPLLVGQKSDGWIDIYRYPLLKNCQLGLSLSADGWMEFFLEERGLITWLDCLPALLTRYYPPLPRKMASEEFFFPLQYAYARCCSLLRLAHRQGIIQLADGNFTAASWPSVSPTSISWQRLLQYEKSQKLLLQVLRVMDEWDDTPPLILAKGLAHRLSDYQRYECRLGEKTEIVRAKLGLIAIVHWLSRSLLTAKLGVIPLSSL
ncbi:MAG: hypothetical protein N5P05_001545 [Chroococcopsis gigantea SAG 12.99]|jgi:hypothetical protein|nr:hypothetical protein [Chlorogloea purpurea SAG 13.99]MDV2999939.1 hypothetical protein [Chroococcopsis gigantea SAG 12.99]